MGLFHRSDEDSGAPAAGATAHRYQILVQVPADMRVAYVRVWQHPGQH